MPGSKKTRGRSSGRLSTINPDAAGIDVGSTFHVVAVPGDRDDNSVHWPAGWRLVDYRPAYPGWGSVRRALALEKAGSP